MHTTIGVYKNMEYKVNGVDPNDLASHINYNITHRFGRALFVDGRCIYKGYLTDKQIDEFKQKIKAENIVAEKISDVYQ